MRMCLEEAALCRCELICELLLYGFLEGIGECDLLSVVVFEVGVEVEGDNAVVERHLALVYESASLAASSHS